MNREPLVTPERAREILQRHGFRPKTGAFSQASTAKIEPGRPKIIPKDRAQELADREMELRLARQEFMSRHPVAERV